MLDLQRIYPEINKYREQLNLPDTMSDKEVYEIVQFTKDMARNFVNDMRNKFDEDLIKLILLNRQNKLEIKPGYDGEYGVVEMPFHLTQRSKNEKSNFQKTNFSPERQSRLF